MQHLTLHIHSTMTVARTQVQLNTSRAVLNVAWYEIFGPVESQLWGTLVRQVHPAAGNEVEDEDGEV